MSIMYRPGYSSSHLDDEEIEEHHKPITENEITLEKLNKIKILCEEIIADISQIANTLTDISEHGKIFITGSASSMIFSNLTKSTRQITELKNLLLTEEGKKLSKKELTDTSI